MPLASGTRFGPYQVLEKLGEGGMGEVYLAHDTRLDRRVALKYLSDPSLDLPRIRERLLREARAAAHLTHPNIAAIYDILDAADTPCIVMEYAAGETLARLADQGPLPVAQVASIGVQLADALARAHAAGVIHRDLKPANIVLTRDGTAKILDFGVARVADAEEDRGDAEAPTAELSQSHLGLVTGTPAYMAPEQLAGRRPGALGDIYSLGVTLYELLTGCRPFRAKTTAELVYEVMSSPTPLASAARESVPPLLNDVVARAMAREAGARYQSASAMADDLREVVRQCAEADGAAAPRGAKGEEVQATSRRRLAIAALSVVVLVAAGVAGYVMWRRSPPAPLAGTQFVAVLPFTVTGDEARASEDAVGFGESLAWALEGLSSVAVLSRPETAEYLTRGDDVEKGAAELGVTMLVGGRASSEGESRRFDVEVKGSDGRRVFTRAYRGQTADVAELQRRAAVDVAAALAAPLTPADRDRLLRVPACLPDAFREYAAGRALLAREDVSGNAAKAEEAFLRAAAKDPRCAPAFAGLSDARWARFSDTNDPAFVESASQAIETAYALDPASPAINLSLAKVYSGKGKSDQAEKLIRAVVERRPYDDEPHRVLSTILEQQGRSEESMAELRRAIALRPANVLNHVVLGNKLFYGGRYADAAAAYERVLQIQPDNLWAIGSLGGAYSMLGEPGKALAAFARARRPDASILNNTAVVYMSLRRYQEAADVLRKAIALDPRNDIRHRNLGDAYLCLGLRREATEEYRQAAELTRGQLQVNDKDGRVLSRHALYEAKLGRAEEAARDAARAVALKPDDASVLYKRAVVHALAGQAKPAVDWLRRALEKGYSRQDAQLDPDLDSIRGRREVAEMLGGAK